MSHHTKLSWINSYDNIKQMLQTTDITVDISVTGFYV
jgi:hypothetical protein